jgi:GNAT superfamily N-acetyltransferase
MSEIRRARRDDVEAIVKLLGDLPDPAGAHLLAFDAIDADPAKALVVAEDYNGVAGTAQLSVLRGLSWQGNARGLIEGFRVDPDRRGSGLGRALIEWAATEAGARGCTRLHLDAGLARVDARPFFERLGFALTYQGFTMALP